MTGFVGFGPTGWGIEGGGDEYGCVADRRADVQPGIKIAFLTVGPASFFAGATALTALALTPGPFTLAADVSPVVVESLGFFGSLALRVCASASRTDTSGEAERLRVEVEVDDGRDAWRGPVILER